MKLNNLQEIRPLQSLDTLPSLKPLSLTRISLVKIPSTIELICLAVNLNYKAFQIINNETKDPKNISVDEYIKKSIALMKVVDNYKDEHLTRKEVREIKKQFKIKDNY